MLRRLLLVTAFSALAVPSAAQEQEQNCSFELLGVGGRAESMPQGGAQIITIHDPFIVTCDDGVLIRANSGRVNQTTREAFLSGDVHFEDPDRQLMAREATYDPRTGHLIARVDVLYTDKINGSMLRGPELEYFRVTEERPQSQMTATQRPTLTMIQQGAAGESEPIEMVADRVLMIGEDDLSAFGNVVITRSDFHATSEEARYNAATEDLELRQNAHIISQDSELSGQVVHARFVESALEHLRARSEAALRSEELNVTGDDLQLFFAEEQLQRAVAVGGRESENGFAEASSAGFRMVSDSLEATFVEEQLSEVHAVGRARAETVDTTTQVASLHAVPVDTMAVVPDDTTWVAPADTIGAVMPEQLAATDLLNSDWVTGDTIIGYFETNESTEEKPASERSVVVPDPSSADLADDPGSSVELRRLVAIGSAQSLYRLRAQNDPDGERRDLNLIIGDRIELEITDGELEVAEVTGLKYGVYLEAGAQPAGPIESTPTTPDGAVQTNPGGGV